MTGRWPTTAEQVSLGVLADGHGVTSSLLRRSEDHAFATWSGVLADAGYDLTYPGIQWTWTRVIAAWRLREACTWRDSRDSITTIRPATTSVDTGV